MFKGNNKKGFALVEILTVIAIIGLLAGILVPSVANIKTSVMKTKSKTQFRKYAMAIGAFYEKNGKFPEFLACAEESRVNLKDHNVAFKNILKSTYHDFKDEEFSKSSENEGKIVDAFDNPNIYIVVDASDDGMIQVKELHEGKPMKARIALFTSPDDGPEYEFVQCTL